jgi:membrane protein DedA with SNARE-associated domain
MEHLLLASITDTITHLIQSWYVNVGYLGIVLAMAIESCCIPLPSEIVMPLAGIYVVGAAGAPFWPSLLGVTLAGAVGCLIGSVVAYGIGRAGGRPLLLKYGRYVLISQADSDRADRWFARFGPPVAFFSRLLPVVRTYISLPAGIYRMNFGKFCLYTVLGSLPWCLLLAFVGYKLGESGLEKLTAPFRGADIVIVALVVALVALYIYRHVKHDRAARAALAARQAQMQRRSGGYPPERAERLPQRDAGMASREAEDWNQNQRRGGWGAADNQRASGGPERSDNQRMPEGPGRPRPR